MADIGERPSAVSRPGGAPGYSAGTDAPAAMTAPAPDLQGHRGLILGAVPTRSTPPLLEPPATDRLFLSYSLSLSLRSLPDQCVSASEWK